MVIFLKYEPIKGQIPNRHLIKLGVKKFDIYYDHSYIKLDVRILVLIRTYY